MQQVESLAYRGRHRPEARARGEDDEDGRHGSVVVGWVGTAVRARSAGCGPLCSGIGDVQRGTTPRYASCRQRALTFGLIDSGNFGERRRKQRGF